MAASPMIDKQEDRQTARSNGIKTTTSSIPTSPRTLPALQNFQEITKHIISTSTRRSSTGMHCNAPPLSSSDSRSSNSSKVRRHSISNVVACTTNTCLSDTGKDCQNLSSADTPDDANLHHSHLDASASPTSHTGLHRRPSNIKLKSGSSLPPSSRSPRPHTSSSNHPPSSSNMVNHKSSHPTSSKNDLKRHGSLQPAALQRNHSGFENQRSGLSNRASTGDEQTHSGCCIMTEPSFSNSDAGSTSHTGLQRKSASKNIASAPSGLSESRAADAQALAKATETYEKRYAGVRDSATKYRPNDFFCKNCRSSIHIMESVCFIANDGRISAARTGASYARHNHHCNVPGCAGNKQYHQSPSPFSKGDSLSKGKAPRHPQPTRRKSHAFSDIGDHESTASSVEGDDCRKQEMESSLRSSSQMSSSVGSDTLDMKKEPNLKETLIKCSEGDESCGNSRSLCDMPIDQNGLDAVSLCKECSPSASTTLKNAHVQHIQVRSSPPTLCISSGVHDDEKGSAHGDDIQAFDDLKCLLSYHGDNEYSCSENGTEATPTPDSLSKGAFDDLSNLDIEQSNCKNEPARPRRSAMGQMRKKYLESLTEQEAEKVRLRKQEVMARKQAGDWMLDCHMEEVLHRLAPNGEAHVKVLVEAFETVMNHSDSDSSQMAHHQDQERGEDLHSS